ncbi:GNAT family N-acetyltransferase [Chryseolinea lacunae]|uniref:GNAT family N-acetyltransferase n=1 Tax=Chryseolinea lacunae TaxID=2801331 RepID=A0ABS1L1I1_9BACT|nr:GNAT family N-acetyltransferase [Chryseolinea lacunae]MBL0745554.1 GNAT family N-acetyltransferase [Chryseolinea lacunae]
MTIRKATQHDSPFLATFILMAMGDIVYRFIGGEDQEQAQKFMEHFTSGTNNQYSYENCWVAETDGEIIAAACVYDGARLQVLREPVIRFLKDHFGNEVTMEDETEPGEYYIDSLGVRADQQGRGTGTRMLQFLIEEFVSGKHETLGLLVDEDNPGAERLYLKLGFVDIGRKIFGGKQMKHLQIKP